jgi:putative transposase
VARLCRYCPVGIPQHVIQRGNNRAVCFAGDSDMAAYAHFLFEAAIKHGLSIHGWVFMTNHVHLLVTPEGDLALSKTMQTLGRQYVRYFNKTYRRTGTLFEGRDGSLH